MGKESLHKPLYCVKQASITSMGTGDDFHSDRDIW